jgi:hypothetical protein
MATDKQKMDVSFHVRVTEEIGALIESKTEELQRRAPVGMVITPTDTVRSALLRGLKCKDDCK